MPGHSESCSFQKPCLEIHPGGDPDTNCQGQGEKGGMGGGVVERRRQSKIIGLREDKDLETVPL